jgi:predicted nucleotidyltransferase
MNAQEALDRILSVLIANPCVEGVFLGGSLANQDLDAYSDIDLGVATLNNAKAFAQVYTQRGQLSELAGEPLEVIERGWEHCKMIAALYGKANFPPIGLEIDIIFSPLRYAGEQMPHAPYRILFDRRGKLAPLLQLASQPQPSQDIQAELEQGMRTSLFYLHDAVKACRRNDPFQAQAMLEELRKLIYYAAARQCEAQVFGAKRADRYLNHAQQRIIARSYLENDEQTVHKLIALYLGCLEGLESRYAFGGGLERLRFAWQELG